MVKKIVLYMAVLLKIIFYTLIHLTILIGQCVCFRQHLYLAEVKKNLTDLYHVVPHEKLGRLDSSFMIFENGDRIWQVRQL